MIRWQIDEIRAKLDPKVRAMGVNKCAKLAFVKAPCLSVWLNYGRGLDLSGISSVARVCGFDMRVELAPLPPKPHQTRKELREWTKGNPLPEWSGHAQKVTDGGPSGDGSAA